MGTSWRGVTPSSMMGVATSMPSMSAMTMNKALNPGAGLLGKHGGNTLVACTLLYSSRGKEKHCDHGSSFEALRVQS